jgi:hypothetical protein
MFASFFQQMFLRANEAAPLAAADGHTGGACTDDLSSTVEQVVDRLYSRLRVVPNYVRLLQEPIATTFRYIDQVAESIAGPLQCSRSRFSEDPLANAFFVSPQHMQEVFSQSDEVRRLFDANPLAEDCWALLCMHRQERTQPGMALVNDNLRRDVMQTSVSFTDHQIVSPGIDEIAARCALKCCMFDAMLSYIQRRATEAKTRTLDLENRLNSLNNRLRRLSHAADPENQRPALTAKIEEIEQQLAAQELRLSTLSEHLDFVAHVMSHPAEVLDINRCSLRLNRQAVKLEDDDETPAYELELSEFRIASQPPRIGAMVRFPRAELLPQPDLLKQADLFLAI